ncbi:pilus assembly protein [bacterium]|nr:pilus assembly protein [bacterium]
MCQSRRELTVNLLGKNLLGKEQGVAFVELAIIFPIVLFLFFGTFEYGLYLQTREKNASLSKQLGNAAFRDCVIPPAGQTNDQTCLDDVWAEFGGFVTSNSPDVEVVLSAYRLNGGTVDLRGRAGTPGGVANSRFPGGSNPLSLAIFRRDYVSAMGPFKQRVVVVEVFERYDVRDAFFNVFGNQTIYEVTIY